MPADLNAEPFKRLGLLAPTGTGEPALQEAADRYASNQDLYSAAADLWEAAAIRLNLTSSANVAGDQITSVSQDGISVTYATKSTIQDNTFKTYNAYMRIAKDFRKRSCPATPLIVGEATDRFEEDPPDLYFDDEENGIIEISNWGD